jgi:RimJ/RimL family protein N-acetyltransferase
MVQLPIRTNRLTIRMMREEHSAALAAYRNDPEVARYQEWAMPFTDDMARDLVAGQSAYDGLVDETFVQLAIEHDGDTVGDLAVQLHDSGRQAFLGYTIRRDRQGHGYATEAAGAMVDALFADGVHRIVASIDPANTASRRVLEKLGFRFEGRALSAVFVRGQWADDDRFALLADEHSLRTTAPA